MTSSTPPHQFFRFDGIPFHPGLACSYSIKPLHAVHVVELAAAANEVPQWSSLGRAVRCMAQEDAVFTVASIRRLVSRDIHMNQPKATSTPYVVRPSMMESELFAAIYLEKIQQSPPEIKDLFSFDLVNVPRPPLSCHLRPDKLWELHHGLCETCQEAYPKSFEDYAPFNSSNPCFIKVFLSWIVRGYVPPFIRLPPPRRGNVTNSSNLSKAPLAVRRTFEAWKEAGFLVENKECKVVSPLTLATKPYEVRRAFNVLGITSSEEQQALLKDLDVFEARVKAFGDPSLRLKIRLCTNMRDTVNVCLPELPFRQTGILEAAKHLKPDHFGCTTDLQDMYHQLPLHPDITTYYGVELEGCRCVHATAQYGESDGSFYGNAMVGLVLRICRDLGFPITGYTDDIFVVGATVSKCRQNRDRVISIFELLGWILAHAKTTEPSQRVAYLGTVLDSLKQTVSIDRIRLKLDLDEVVQLLESRKATKVQIQSLAGRLEWIASVMNEGRAFVSSLHSAAGWARRPTSPIHVEEGSLLLSDLKWWKRRLEEALDGGDVPWSRIYRQYPVKVLRSFSDASGSKGFAITCAGHVLQGTWSEPEAQADSSGQVVDIASQELLPLLLALRHFPDDLSDSVLVFSTDNAATALAINKGASTAPVLGPLLREIMSKAAAIRCTIIGDHVPREFNIFNDALSKEVPYELALQQGMRILV